MKNPLDYKYSVIIPVFNSEDIINETIQQTVDFFTGKDWQYEIVLVNDGSPDNSWTIIRELADANPNLIVIDLLRNYGQHTAIYAGLHHVTGDFAITMDDDLQNPPGEIEALVHRILEGYDVVYGKFRIKQHSQVRTLGSRVVYRINQGIFNLPSDLTVSNFRIMDRGVVERIKDYRTLFPYITGLTLMFSHKRANVMVDHHPRKVGQSNYNIVRIATLVFRILFSYSTYPLRVVSVIGFVSAILAFLIGGYALLRALIIGTTVPGWASMFLAISFFGGINITIVSMLGEYVLRLIQQSSHEKLYHIRYLHQTKTDEVLTGVQ